MGCISKDLKYIHEAKRDGTLHMVARTFTILSKWYNYGQPPSKVREAHAKKSQDLPKTR